MPSQTSQKAPRGFRRKLLGDILHGVKRYFALGILATLCATALAYVTPLIVSFTVDSVIGDKAPSLPAPLAALFEQMGGRAFFATHLPLVASLVVLVTLLNGAAAYLRAHCIAYTGEGLAKRLRDMLYTHLEAVPYSYHVGVQTGDLVQRCTSDVETVRRFLQMQAMELVRTAAMACTAFSIMLPISGVLTAVSTCLLPVLIIFSFFYFRGVQRQFTRSDEAEGALSTAIQENLTGVRVVRAFAQERAELDKFTQLNKSFHDITLHLTTLMGGYWGLSDTIGYLQIALSGVCGVWFVVHGTLSLGNMMLFTTYTSMLTFPMRQLGRLLADLGKADISLKRLEEILLAPVESEPGKALTPEIDGHIVFDDVCFDYGDGVPVLSHISFTADPGQTIGILGSTGSGKSSMVQLLQRLYPITSGKITLSGVDIRDIERHHLRRNVGIVLQEPFLYSRTIGENIAIARPDASQEEITDAARTASVHDVIESFADGYETVVGERGVTLSGGQKQRVAIARMLLQNTPVLIFDDSLSAVDAETDAAIRDALHERRHGTMFLISHRIATLRQADKILVLDQGRIVQTGTHAQLCAEDGLYRRVCVIQNELDVPDAGAPAALAAPAAEPAAPETAAANTAGSGASAAPACPAAEAAVPDAPKPPASDASAPKGGVA